MRRMPQLGLALLAGGLQIYIALSEKWLCACVQVGTGSSCSLC